MRIVVTGSAGRVGRAIFGALAAEHEVIGIDRTPFSTVHVVGDFANEQLLKPALQGADAVIHAAALHAPHVGTVTDAEFHRINVEGTRRLSMLAKASGVRRLVFTSTTALYGDAIAPNQCSWITEETVPQPRTIYHRTKLEAEHALEELASPEFVVRVMRMSRSFPEPADHMALYRLHRGIDIRDVADAHILALADQGAAFERFIVSGVTAFREADCGTLAVDPAAVLDIRAPELLSAYRDRAWALPQCIDRVYSSKKAMQALDWRPRHGFEEVLAQLDRRSLEVLPAGAGIVQKSE